MKITPHLFEAHLKCPTKCWLRAAGESPSGNTYAEWVQAHNESYRAAETERLLAQTPPGESIHSPGSSRGDEAHSSASILKSAKWRLAVDVVAQASVPLNSGGANSASPTNSSDPGPRVTRPSELCSLESRLHAVERVPAAGRGKAAQFIPIRFIFRNKLTKDDKLLLAFDAFVLSKALGREVSLGKIIHGDTCGCARQNAADLQTPTTDQKPGATATLWRAQPRVTKVKTAALAGEVRKRLEKITALLAATRSADSHVRASQANEDTRGLSGPRSEPMPPDLVLNRHCAECEFQARCRKIAIEKDDLSLLAGMRAKERQKLRSKGIFTVTQLSYTFRPHRRPKRQRDKREKYHHSLKALAIREKKIHIVGSPELKIDGTPVFLDVEGLPDRDFYYLIGLRIGHGDSAVQHSLWADTVADEGKIWREFLAILETVEKPVLIHYGSYETTFLERMSECYGNPPKGTVLVKAIDSAINLISVMFAHIYFPTHSNSLKEIAGWLGSKWSEANASGIRTICWRNEWEKSGEFTPKQKLITYNSEDCIALQMITTIAFQICSGLDRMEFDTASPSEITAADVMPRFNFKWGRFTSLISDFEAINLAARWSYQRDRVYVRTDKPLRKAVRKHRVAYCRAFPPNKEVFCQNRSTCPQCHRAAQFVYAGPRSLQDLRFSPHGVRRWIVRYHFRVYQCRYCHFCFGKPKEFWGGTKYGRGVVALIVYSVIQLRIVQKAIGESLNAMFELGISDAEINRLKASAANFYQETRRRILARLVSGRLIHADETRIILKGTSAYVWVFTSFHEVVYFYAETREGNLLHELLAGFGGVLVSDFYAPYDAMPCAQQKCLIHLMRDLNDAVMDQPYDEEMKRIAVEFADVLRAIVETIDRRGLKRHFLSKHRRQVERFYRKLEGTMWQSESALKCKERFEKNRGKLFTFLDYDGVPWNNNNAEHAIKAFAKLRRAIVGLSTPKGIEEYLVVLSVCQTCKYMGVDFLDFLRSGEQDIHAFAARRRGRRRRSPVSKPSAPPATEPATKSP